MTERWRRMLPAVCLLAALILRAGCARQAAAQGVRQAAMVVFPSLFPMCVATRRLTHSGFSEAGRGQWFRRLFGLPQPAAAALAAGLCGGYPLGVQTACELYRSGRLDRNTAERAICFCNNTGPAFFFGMVGAAAFENVTACALLYAGHVFSAIVTGMLLSAAAEGEPQAHPEPAVPEHESLPQTLRICFVSVAQLCGYVVFFSVVLRLLLELGPVQYLRTHGPWSPAVFDAVLSGAVDLPSGIAAAAKLVLPAQRFVLCAAAVGWGGVCVHMQAAGLWQAAGLRPRGYYAGKLVQMLCAIFFAFPAARMLFGGNTPVWPGFLPFAALFFKKAIAFFLRLGYNEKKPERRPIVCCFARRWKNPAPAAPARSR